MYIIYIYTYINSHNIQICPKILTMPKYIHVHIHIHIHTYIYATRTRERTHTHTKYWLQIGSEIPMTPETFLASLAKVNPVNMCGCVLLYVYVCGFICVCMYLCICHRRTNMCIHTHIYIVCLYACVYVSMYVCMYVYIYIYIITQYPNLSVDSNHA